MRTASLPVDGPIKVAFVIGQLGVGGGERQLYLLLKHLDRSRFDPFVITFNPGQGDYFEPKLRELGVRVRGVARTWNKASRLLTFSRMLRQERARIVHAWDLHLTAMAAVGGALASVPVRLGSVRCDPGRVAGAWYGFAKGAGLRATIANSTLGKVKLEEMGIRSDRIEVLFNGVELRPTPARTRADLRASWGVPPEALLLISVGRLDKGKNHALLLRALSSLVPAADIHLVLLGDGPERAPLEEATARLGLSGRVHLPGIVADAGDVLYAADLFCLSSDAEGMPNVLLEAASAGLPLVSTDVGGARDIIADGENGCIVPIGDASAMAGAIASLARDPALRERMALAARRRVERVFSIEAAVSALQGCYERFATTSRSRDASAVPAHAAQSGLPVEAASPGAVCTWPEERGAASAVAGFGSQIQKRFEDTQQYLAKDFDVRVRAIIAAEMLGNVSGQDVLDVGCGDGRLSLQFAGEARRVTQLDFSRAMLERARERCPPEMAGKVTFVLGDFSTVRCPAAFDVVLCVGVLAHVVSIVDTIAKLSSVLKPGGRLLLQISDNDVALTRLQHALSTLRNVAIRRATKENRTSLRDVVAQSTGCGLDVVQVRRYSLMLPGLGRLPNRVLFKYQLASARRAWLRRLGSDRIILLRKR